MIAKIEGMNLKKENPKADPEITEPQRESDKMLLQIQDTLNDHRHVRLLEVFNKKECIKVRMGDFDIDCVLDEETQVNVMTEITWEAIGRPVMTPSLSGIGLFKEKLVNLCGRLNQISMNANGTSAEEDFEIIKFIEDNALFTMLLGNPWIERDQARKKEEEIFLEQHRQELKDFMTRRIAQLIEEQRTTRSYITLGTHMSKLSEHQRTHGRLKFLSQIKKIFYT
jgi:hypothetical protein